MAIRAIIFDLGGVLLRTSDYTLREQLADRLGMTRPELEQFIFGGESGLSGQKGEITIEQHWENLANQLGYSRHAFQAVLDDFFANDVLDIELVDYVRRLHKKYKTGLLSNAFDDVRQIIYERWHFADAFDDMVISAEVGLVKPDGRIFRLALEQLGVKADEAIFVDDYQHNVESAVAVGMHGIRFADPQQVRLELKQLLDGNQG